MLLTLLTSILSSVITASLVLHFKRPCKVKEGNLLASGEREDGEIEASLMQEKTRKLIPLKVEDYAKLSGCRDFKKFFDYLDRQSTMVSDCINSWNYSSKSFVKKGTFKADERGVVICLPEKYRKNESVLFIQFDESNEKEEYYLTKIMFDKVYYYVYGRQTFNSKGEVVSVEEILFKVEGLEPNKPFEIFTFYEDVSGQSFRGKTLMKGKFLPALLKVAYKEKDNTITTLAERRKLDLIEKIIEDNEEKEIYFQI